MVRSYVNNNIEIKRFEKRIYESNKLIDYHNESIGKLKNTIRIYGKIIDELGSQKTLSTLRYKDKLMKKEFYDKNRKNVTSKVMLYICSILILDGIVFACLIFLFLCAIGKF